VTHVVQHPGVINIYVIELSHEVLRDAAFLARNPGYVHGQACYYVGSSIYEPEVRFREHKEGEHSCRRVRKYGLHVVTEKCRKVYTTDTKVAEAEEAAYAEELRARGYGVWQN
jgi:hypothetical protein